MKLMMRHVAWLGLLLSAFAHAGATTSRQLDAIHATGGTTLTVPSTGANVLSDSASQAVTNKGINCSNNTCTNFPAPTTYQEVPSGTVNGSNVTFTLAHTPSSGTTTTLVLDGLIQRLTTDYTISGATITMVTAPKSGSGIYAIYY